MPALSTKNGPFRHKKSPSASGKALYKYNRLLFVTFVEFLYATSGIHENVFTCVERVRSRSDLQLYQWIGYPFQGDGFAGFDGRAADEVHIGRSVHKYHFFVIWMYTLFHRIFYLKGYKSRLFSEKHQV
jgi:hypothetical protein